MRFPMRRPTPALVISCIALLIALGGTGYATVLQVPRNSVGTAQLKNSAVTSAKVKNRSLLRRDFAAGQVPAGPRGPAGPAGSAGPAGPPGLSGVERVASTSDNNTSNSKTQTVTCPAGKRLLGGGARVDPILSQLAIQTSFPDNDNVYRATAREVTITGANWSLTVFAVCANAS
jgi:hypothetical protein